MFRRSNTWAISRGAAFKLTPCSRGIFSSRKETQDHRKARENPWWFNWAIAGGLLVFVNVASFVLYNGNRWYQSWRPSGNDIFINTSMDEKLFTRPDLAVVAVKILLHHALTNSTTPFANPVVAPPAYREEALELSEFVCDLHKQQPLYSIPDLWAMLTCKALSRLGGPIIYPYRGRENVKSDLPADVLIFKEPLISENDRDVLNMKRVLVRQGFSLEQLVAIMGCLRGIGFQDMANFHTQQVVRPKVKGRKPSAPEEDEFGLPDTDKKTTLNPYVFSADYFDLLLDYNWKKSKFSSQSVYRCSEKDRKRNIKLLDPFSEQKADSVKSIVKMQEKEKSEAEKSKSDKENGGKYGRSGEASFIPSAKANTAIQEEEDATIIYEEEEPAAKIDPCEHITMNGIDVMLLDDGLTKGWVHRFNESEVDFYGVVTDVVLELQKRGHNVNNLYLPKK